MKKTIFILLIIISIPLLLSAQNEIHLIATDSIIPASKIYYSDGVLYFKVNKKQKDYQIMNCAEVDYITKKGDYYGLSPKRLIKIKNILLNSDTILKGASDACRYYDTKGAQTATFITTFGVGAILGLVPAISISSTNPKEKNLNMPENSLKNEVLYKDGYKQQAKKIKQKNTWKGYANGVAALFTLALILQYSGILRYYNR